MQRFLKTLFLQRVIFNWNTERKNYSRFESAGTIAIKIETLLRIADESKMVKMMQYIFNVAFEFPQPGC